MKLRGIFVLSLMFAAGLTAQTVPQVRSEMLVSTLWLAGHLSDPNLIVLHVGRDRSAYDAGHIPGARFLPLTELMITRDGVPNELPPVSALRSLFERAGVSDDSRVVLYGNMLGLAAARAWFTLDYLGHGGSAALLDGGLEAWRAERRPLTTEPPRAKTGWFTPKPQAGVAISLEQVRELANGAPSYVLLDARPAEDYDGSKPAEGLSRPGHIPGAVNVYWMEHLSGKENPVFRPAAELREIYERAGVKPGSRVVAYCQSGVQASHTYFTLKYLGYEAGMYDGSFRQWSNTSSTPVATGRNPR